MNISLVMFTGHIVWVENDPEQRNDFTLNRFCPADLLSLTDAVGEDQAFASPFGCCIQEVLLCCHPSLSEECVDARLGLVQRLETTCHILSTATDGTGQHSNERL